MLLPRLHTVNHNMAIFRVCIMRSIRVVHMGMGRDRDSSRDMEGACSMEVQDRDSKGGNLIVL
jgi:hypothetical protein